MIIVSDMDMTRTPCSLCRFRDDRSELCDMCPAMQVMRDKNITCDKCKYFKIVQEPLRGADGLYDMGQAVCEKHDLVTDFINHGKFKRLDICDCFEERK